MKPKLLFSVLLAILFNIPFFAQGFEIGRTTITFIDSQRNNRSIPTEIFYPADSESINVPLTATAGDFPVLAFGHGFVMGYDAYENIWTTVVPSGFIMAFPKTEGGILPSHLEFAKDLAFVLLQLKGLNDDPTSIFFNRVSAFNAVMGHSMGGGAAILAANLDSTIGALAVLAAAETNPSAIDAAATVAIPSLIVAAENDCVTPPNENQIPMYDALASSCKTYISINGGSHCQMANSNLLCSFGEATCSPSPAISRAEQHSVINSYLSNWLLAQLDENCPAGAEFDTLISTDDLIAFEKNCLQCNPLSSANFFESGIRVYPNPFENRFTIEIDNDTILTCSVYDVQMRKVYAKTFSGTAEFECNHLNSGLYIYTVESSGIIIKKGKLIKE